jgi:vacuolar-type H+-ATPase subunit D/Vma8
MSLRDEIKNKNLEDKQQLRATLKMKIDDLIDQFKQAMKNYEEMNEERQRLFYDMKSKDEVSAKEIDLQMRKIQALNVSIF